MNETELIKNLCKLYDDKNIKAIDDITAYIFDSLEDKTIEYIKTISPQEVFLQILCFNIFISEIREMHLPLFFINNYWIVVKITNKDENNIFQSSIEYVNSNMEELFKKSDELKLDDLLKKTKNAEFILN